MIIELWKDITMERHNIVQGRGEDMARNASGWMTKSTQRHEVKFKKDEMITLTGRGQQR